MPRLGISKSYQLLAAEAGRRVVLAGVEAACDSRQAAELVAGDEEARDLRDTLWLDYERMLRDRSYKYETLVEWLAKQNSPVTMASVQRDRERLRDAQRRREMAAEKMRDALAEMKAGDPAELYRGGVGLALQAIINRLLSLGDEDLSDMSPRELVGMMDVLGRLGKGLAETERVQQIIAEKRAEFDRQVAARKGRRRGGLTDQDVQEIRESVFGKG